MTRKVHFGEDFEIDVKFIEDKRSHLRESFRGSLAIAVVASGLIVLMGAALIGILDGTWNELDSVWAALSFPLGMIVSFYFQTGGKDDS